LTSRKVPKGRKHRKKKPKKKKTGGTPKEDACENEERRGQTS